MRILAAVLLLLIAAVQYPIWIGRGGWTQVWGLERELAQQRETNAALRARNEALDAEVRDLKTGYDAIEERARAQIGMVRPNEVFFQILPAAPPPVSGSDRVRR